MKPLDFVSKYAERFADEWFKIIRCILTISALQFVATRADDFFLKSMPILSIGVLWAYIFFGYSEKYFQTLKAPKDNSFRGKIIFAFISIVVCALLLMIAQKIAEIAFLLLQQSVQR